jgi:hypothetical protein
MACLAGVALCALYGGAEAATMAELKKIDRNHNGALDAGDEFRAYLRLEKLTGDLTDGQLADIGALQADIALQGSIPFSRLAVQEDEQPEVSGCDRTQTFYLRNERIDVSIYGESIEDSAAEGAAISFTDNELDGSQTAAVQAFAAAVLVNPCRERPAGVPINRAWVSGYALALSVGADGKLTDTKAKEKSSLRPGLDAQIEIASGPFDLQALTFTPYYQTDFRGEAQAYGFAGSWEPYKLKWRLGGSYTRFASWFDFFYQLKAEAIGLRVEEAGLTDLENDTDYLWWGGTAVFRAFLFPEALNDRLTWITTYRAYADDRSGKDVELFATALAYNLTDEGNTSISFKYENGTKRDTLEEVDQYLVSLNAKY